MASSNRFKMPPLWKVLASILSYDVENVDFSEGREIRHKRAYNGIMYVHGNDIADARQRAEKIIKDVYEVPILGVDFFNTHQASKEELNHSIEGFEGLEALGN